VFGAPPGAAAAPSPFGASAFRAAPGAAAVPGLFGQPAFGVPPAAPAAPSPFGSAACGAFLPPASWSFATATTKGPAASAAPFFASEPFRWPEPPPAKRPDPPAAAARAAALPAPSPPPPAGAFVFGTQPSADAAAAASPSPPPPPPPTPPLLAQAAALRSEAASLAALAAASAAALGPCRAALAAAAAELAQETSRADAEAAAALASRARVALAQLEAERGLQATARARRPAVAAARALRVKVLLEQEELASARRKALLLEDWSEAMEEKHEALSATLSARLAEAEAGVAAASAVSAADAATLAACYPEVAAATAGGGFALEAGIAAAGGAQLSMAAFEVVDTLHRTPSSALLRCRRRDSPGAPDACLKVFTAASAATFLAESRHLRTVTAHPLVVALEGAFVDESGRGVLVMPFHPLGSLRPWVEGLKARRGDLSGGDWASVRRTFRQLVAALAFIHSRGLAHRDLKPENVLWSSPECIALTDFGLSRDLRSPLELTLPCGGGGTAAYAAPEADTARWKASLPRKRLVPALGSHRRYRVALTRSLRRRRGRRTCGRSASCFLRRRLAACSPGRGLAWRRWARLSTAPSPRPRVVRARCSR